MAASITITRNTTLPDSSDKEDFHNLVDTATATIADISNANIAAAAAIADTKLATISTAGKVNTSALTTTSQAAGDIMYNNGSGWARLAVGTADQFLRVNAGATAPEWDTVATTPIVSSDSVTDPDVTTSTSATYEDLADMSITFTPSSADNPILILFNAKMGHQSDGGSALYILDIGGNIASTERQVNAGINGAYQTASIMYLTTLAASEQTIKVQWKEADSGTTTSCDDRTLTVIEFRA